MAMITAEDDENSLVLVRQSRIWFYLDSVLHALTASSASGVVHGMLVSSGDVLLDVMASLHHMIVSSVWARIKTREDTWSAS